MIGAVHLSNNRQLNTLSTVHREIEIDQMKKREKNVYILYTHGITTEESFTE